MSQNVAEEIFKAVPGFEGFYEVSNLGRVKSIPRKIKNNGGYYISKERFLSQNKRDKNYFNVTLYKNNYCKSFRVHVLVAMAFLNYNPDGFEIIVDHINSDKSDNRLSNLQVVSQRQNIAKERINKSSNYTGVQLSPNKKNWISYMEIKGVTIYLGRFKTAAEASEQYKKGVMRKSEFINPAQFRSIL